MNPHSARGLEIGEGGTITEWKLLTNIERSEIYGRSKFIYVEPHIECDDGIILAKGAFVYCVNRFAAHTGNFDHGEIIKVQRTAMHYLCPALMKK